MTTAKAKVAYRISSMLALIVAGNIGEGETAGG